jgi:hypothetical protein
MPSVATCAALLDLPSTCEEELIGGIVVDVTVFTLQGLARSDLFPEPALPSGVPAVRLSRQSAASPSAARGIPHQLVLANNSLESRKQSHGIPQLSELMKSHGIGVSATSRADEHSNAIRRRRTV